MGEFTLLTLLIFLISLEPRRGGTSMLERWFTTGTQNFRSKTRPMKATKPNYARPPLDIEIADRAFQTFTFACG